VEQFGQLFLTAPTGIGDLAGRTAAASIRDGSVIKGYCKAGHELDNLADIRNLNLRDIRVVMPRLDLANTSAAMVEGAAAGFVVAGGELVKPGSTTTLCTSPRSSTPSSWRGVNHQRTLQPKTTKHHRPPNKENHDDRNHWSPR
jgi:hypothetical protein